MLWVLIRSDLLASDGYPQHILHENICCGYSLEVTCWGASNEYPQHMFSWRHKKMINTFGLKKTISLRAMLLYADICTGYVQNIYLNLPGYLLFGIFFIHVLPSLWIIDDTFSPEWISSDLRLIIVNEVESYQQLSFLRVNWWNFTQVEANSLIVICSKKGSKIYSNKIWYS